jgi:purine nucleoside permease
MFSTLSWQKRVIALCLLGAVLTITLAFTPLLNAVHAQAKSDALPPVKVLIITMFPPERDEWLSHGTWKVVSTPIGSIDTNDGAVYCHIIDGKCNGVYLTMTGPEKVNASTSMMAVLRDPDLSFKGAYFLTTGTASTSPSSEGTLGFVAWANWVIDRDQGTHVIPETAPDYPSGYQPPNTSFPDNTADFQLNRTLVQEAYNVTAGLKLADSPEAQAERARYPEQVGRKPFVAQCDTVTSDSYLVGSRLSAQTKYIASKLTDTARPGNYCTMEDEDSAVAGALNRLSLTPGGPNYLQCYLNLRGATTFDQPPPGQSVEEFIAQHFRVNSLVLANLYKAGSTVINKSLLHHACTSD